MKRLSIVLLALALIYPLTACNGQADQYDKPNIEISDDSPNIEPFDGLSISEKLQFDETDKFSYVAYTLDSEVEPYVENNMEFPDNMFIYKVESSGDNDIAKFGYMDENFIKLSDPISLSPNPFSMGLVLIDDENGSYCVDRDFNEAIELCKNYYLMENGIVRISTDSIPPEATIVSTIDNPETYLVPAKVDTGSFSKNGKIFNYGFKTVSDFLSEDDSKDNAFVIEPIFEDARPFIRGLAAVKADGKWGFIDTDGNFVIDSLYLSVQDFIEPAAFVYLGEYVQVKDSEGNQSLNVEGNWGLIDTGGVPLTEFNIRMFAHTFHEGWAAVYYSNESNYINTSGKSLLKENIESFAIMEPFCEGIAVIHNPVYGKPSFYDSSGVNLFNLDINNAPKFSDGLAAIKKRGKYTYINMTGNTAIDEEYLSANDFSNGYAFVVKKFGEAGFIIDKMGTRYLEELRIDGMTKFNDEGYALAYSIVDKNQTPQTRLYYMIRIENIKE